MITNIGLEDECKRLNIPLVAVVSKDELKGVPRRNGLYIINLEDSDQGSGTHWVSFWRESGKAAYYDSFGFDPPAEVQSYLKKYVSNTKQIQDINSEYCGWYCLALGHFMMTHKKDTTDINHRFQSFIRLFDSQTKKNEAILKKYLSGVMVGGSLYPYYLAWKAGKKYLKRKSGVYPPRVRSTLDKIGNNYINNITVVRTPISSVVRTFINALSLGTYNKALKSLDYDKAFHLGLLLNNQYFLDKQAVVVLEEKDPRTNESETMDVSLGGATITFNELIDKTRKYMGNDKFSNYDARTNNCQVFVYNTLVANGLMTDSLNTFINQDADSIFKRMPWFVEDTVKDITDLGAVSDRITTGESLKRKKISVSINKTKPTTMPRKSTAYTEFVKKHMAGSKGLTRKQLNEKMAHVAKMWREHKGKSK